MVESLKTLRGHPNAAVTGGLNRLPRSLTRSGSLRVSAHTTPTTLQIEAERT